MSRKRQAQQRSTELPCNAMPPDAVGCGLLYGQDNNHVHSTDEPAWVRPTLNDALEAASLRAPHTLDQNNSHYSEFVNQNSSDSVESQELVCQSARLGGIWATPAGNEDSVTQPIQENSSHGASCLAEWRARQQRSSDNDSIS